MIDARRMIFNYDSYRRLLFTGSIMPNSFAIFGAPGGPPLVINDLAEKDPPVDADLLLIEDSEASHVRKKVQIGNLPHPVLPDDITGVVQIVNAQTGAVNTGTTIMPSDDSIPQKTEGDEYMTLAITPTNSSNILHIHVIINAAFSEANTTRTGALFQDSTANALAAAAAPKSGAHHMGIITIRHKMVAGTTSSTTFKIRAGGSVSGTLTFNGSNTARRYGGIFASSITITEAKV